MDNKKAFCFSLGSVVLLLLFCFNILLPVVFCVTNVVILCICMHTVCNFLSLFTTNWYFQCKFNIQGFSLQWKHACIELKIVDFSDWCRWLKVLKDRPVQPPSGFLVALHYQSLQIISNSFRELPLHLLDIIQGFFQKRLIFYYTSVFHHVFFVLLGVM